VTRPAPELVRTRAADERVVPRSADQRDASETLQQAAKAARSIPIEDVLRWGWAAGAASDAVWDFEGTRATAERHAKLVRDAGALAQLPLPLAALGNSAIWSGDFAGAAPLVAECESVATATGRDFPSNIALRLRALQGREAEASALIVSAIEHAAAEGQGLAATNAHWAAAILYNSLARYDEAAAAARRATSDTLEPWVSVWALPELVEAAARRRDTELARDGLERLTESTQPFRTDIALGIEARCRALLSPGAAAEPLYRDAIDRLGRAELRPDLARAHLLYGEWLRREGRRVDARDQLRTAHDMFVAIGMEAFAERARRELSATGEKVRRRSAETRDELTPQEEQIARLARDGLSNPEIGAMLFLSPRTVGWHLHKVFGKLGISSRRELPSALPEQPITGKRQ
jgi:ATP/maltotriose-dependent transcriptional regulator MalT